MALRGSASDLGAPHRASPLRWACRAMNTRELTVRTGSARGLADLTAACSAFLADIDADAGLLSIFVPHATAGLVIVEIGAGSDDDLLDALDRSLPREDRL